ncbi:MAG: DUF4282 domain-containing protein [Actinomycetota bacterium]|nr:DUF4282 domain-containing protein [Actinomycetota bacterium]
MSDPNTPSGGQGGYGQGAAPPPPPPPSGPPPDQPYGGRPAEPKNFFAALFDFGFNTFVTPMIVKVVYILITVAIALAWVVFVIGGFVGDEPFVGVLALLLGWIPALLYLAFFRMTLEFYYGVVRMSQDINRRLPHG